MLKPPTGSVIRLRGVRQNNLKNFDLDLPLHRLIVITGLSGSGKSSLAFDTLFAEGQRRYIETFSPYARQFFDRMDKPRVDSVEGIPPAIAVEQRNAVRTTRSTVGTMTEICDHMKALWPHIAQLHCRKCHQPVRQDSPQQIWEALVETAPTSAASEVLVTFDVPLSQRLSVRESLALVARQGFQRLLVENEPVRLEDPRVESALRVPAAAITVVQDRLKLAPSQRSRFIEACEQAYHFGKGRLAVRDCGSGPGPAGAAWRFSNRLHCAACDIEYAEPTPALFSFNHPAGACPACRGFGRVISIDYDRALPDRSKTLAEGVVKPWLTGHGLECQQDLIRACRKLGIPTDVPFEKLSKTRQNLVIEGEPGYGKDPEHEWPRAWYGVKGYFRWLESKAYKMHVRVLLSRYRAYTTCPECAGARFQPETLLYRLTIDDWRLTSRGCGGRDGTEARASIANRKSEITLSDFYALSVRDAAALIEDLRPIARRREAGRVGFGRNPFPAWLPEQRGPGLSDPGPADAVVVRRRNRARQSHHLSWHAAGEHVVRSGRTQRGPAPARHGSIGAHSPAVARRGEYRRGGRTRSRRDPRGRPDRRSRPGTWRDGRAHCLRRRVPRDLEIEGQHYGTVFEREEADQNPTAPDCQRDRVVPSATSLVAG